MIKAGLLDGDFLVVDRSLKARTLAYLLFEGNLRVK